ncbi:MAG: YkvA family protein [Gemmatimonadota bacterium]
MPRIRIGRSRRRRRSARRTVARLLRELPHLFGLLIRLMKDPRVSRLDRVLFGVVMAYVLMPADLLPDFLGFIGLADDLYLVGLALNRLFSRAGPHILLEHWHGNPRALGFLIEGVEDIGALLPAKVRNALKGFV